MYLYMCIKYYFYIDGRIHPITPFVWVIIETYVEIMGYIPLPLVSSLSTDGLLSATLEGNVTKGRETWTIFIVPPVLVYYKHIQ